MAEANKHKQVLIELYKRNNPEKIGDVDFLLTKFAGREAEMIEKIRQKYYDFAPVTLAEEAIAPVSPRRKRKFPAKKLAIFGVVAMILGITGATAWQYADYFLPEPPPAEFLYVIADTVYTHDICDLSKESRLSTIPYGTPLEVKSRQGTCILIDFEGATHYVPQKYLGSEQEFLEINTIYGNEEARELYDNSYEKRALRNYFNRVKIAGDLLPEQQRSLYDSLSGKDVWQVYGRKKDSDLNVVAKGRFLSTEEEKPFDFAAIISNKAARDVRKLVLFEFDEHSVDHFVDEIDLANYPNYYIKTIEYWDELYLFGTAYIQLPPKASGEEEDKKIGILLEKPNSNADKYLVEFNQGEMELYSLRKGLFGMFQKERIYQP